MTKKRSHADESKHKSKKHAKKAKSKKSKKRERCSSSSNETSADEWVENTGSSVARPQLDVKSTSQEATSEGTSSQECQMSADSWLERVGLSVTSSTDERRVDRDEQRRLARAAEEREREEKLQALSWKNTAESSGEMCSSVGDGGSSWLLRALERARQQAAEQERSLEEVVADRWGSMDKFNELLRRAKTGASSSRASNSVPSSRHHQTDRRSGSAGWRRSEGKARHDRGETRGRDSHRHRDHLHSDRKRRSPDDKDRYRTDQTVLASPDRGVSRSSRERNCESRPGDSSRDVSSSSRRARGPSPSVISEPGVPQTSTARVSRACPDEKQERSSPDRLATDARSNETKDGEKDGLAREVMTVDEMNELAARAMRAELNDEPELATQLRTRLAQARDLSGPPPPHGRQQQQRTQAPRTEVVVLASNTATLQQLHETQRRGTCDDDTTSQLARMSRRRDVPRHTADDQWTLDDAFESDQRRLPSDKQQQRDQKRREQQQQRTALHQHRAETQCTRCVDNKATLRHLICCLADKCHVSVPAGGGLVPGHCLIVPNQHVASWLQADEDVWREMSLVRASVSAMFASRQSRAVVFETAVRLQRASSHAVLHCVPVPEHSAQLAPIYFKKALQECETEWSLNKKVISLQGKSVRRCVPRGLDYFYVDFDDAPGFAHLVEDVAHFPDHFAPQVIAGMLDLEPSAWRKKRPLSFVEQCDKVNQFRREWDKFDCTKTDNTC